MRVIELNAMKWKTVIDFYDALLAAIGAPAWHSKSPDALIDSMVWGGMNAAEPPPDPNSAKGYRILTAYPTNSKW